MDDKPTRDVMTTDGAYTRKDRRDNRMSTSGDLAHLECPEWMDDVGRKMWKAMADLVYRAGISTEMDYFSFEAMVTNYREMRKLHRFIGSYGYVNDEGKSRPEVAAYQAAQRMHMDILKAYGMTPKSRGVVAVPVGEMEKRAAPGDELQSEGFGKFKVTEGGVNKPDQRLNDRKRRNVGGK